MKIEIKKKRRGRPPADEKKELAKQFVDLVAKGASDSEAIEKLGTSELDIQNATVQAEIKRLLLQEEMEGYKLNRVITAKATEIALNDKNETADQLRALKMLADKKEVGWSPANTAMQINMVALGAKQAVLEDALSILDEYDKEPIDIQAHE